MRAESCYGSGMAGLEWNAADSRSVYHYACNALFATEDDQHEKPPVRMVTDGARAYVV